MTILPYLEIPVVKHCNLNCRYCSHFANVEDEYFMPVASYETDMARMSCLVSNIAEIRLLGGEPLLHPHLREFIKISRRYFPDAALKVVTNGLLIPSVDACVLQEIAGCGATFDISLYQPTQKIEREICERLYRFGIKFYISEPVIKFQRRLLPRPEAAIEKTWQACNTKNCFVLCEGKISYCYAPQLVEMAEKKFGYHFYIGNSVADIADSRWTGESLLEFLQQPHECCAYCGQPETVDWMRTQCKPGLSDWFVEKPIK